MKQPGLGKKILELRKQKDKLKLILNTLYRSVAYAFKDYALGRFFSKDFDDDFENRLAEFVAFNTGVWVSEIDETTRKRLAKVIDNSYANGLSVDANWSCFKKYSYRYGCV